MDYRQYDNALGRFYSIDALSERAYDITPYRFALNNPNLWMDPSGLFETRKEAKEYRKEHGISGGITKQKDGTFTINDKKNGISYSKGDDTNFGGDKHGNDGVVESVLVESTVKKSESNFVSNGKKINDYVGLGLTPVEYLPGSFRVASAAQGISPKFYSSGWGGNQFTNTYNVGKIGRGIGFGGSLIGLALDTKGVINYYNPNVGPKSPNSVHPAKAGLNTGMAAYGLYINPIPALLYSGIDTFYPGGWDGAMKDTAVRQAEFDRVVNKNSGIPRQFIFPYGSQKF